MEGNFRRLFLCPNFAPSNELKRHKLNSKFKITKFKKY